MDNINAFDGVGFRKDDINFAQILRIQLDRVGMAGLLKTDAPRGMKPLTPYDLVEISVDVLTCLLFPYMDDEFQALKAKTTNNDGSIHWMDQLKCCVDLMHRRGLLLKEEIEVIE